jgi:periplasmic protein TonB
VPRKVAGPVAKRDTSDVLPKMLLESQPIWSGLYGSVRDAFFPRKLPPLELTSTPVPVVDRMATKANPWAVGTSTLVNGSILVIVICLGLKTVTPPFGNPVNRPIDLSQWKLPEIAKGNRGGGSGGSNELTDPIQGRPSRVELNPVTPPQVAIIDNPKLPREPAIAAPPDVKLPDDSRMPNLGVAKSPNVTLVPNGSGAHGIGWNGGGGIGPGDGPGSGPGSEAGVYVPGRSGVTAPVAVNAPEAEFSDEARRQKYQGICMVALIVDARGYPQNLRVVQRLGMGLDEKAIEAIRKYRFKPAMKDGKPVASVITVEVDFRLY